MDYSKLVKKATEKADGLLKDFCHNSCWEKDEHRKVFLDTARTFIELRRVFKYEVYWDDDFEKPYFKYYVMRYVTEDFRKLYFKTFRAIKKGDRDYNIRDLAYILKDDDRVMFSFATKMLNMYDGVSPIFDSHVTSSMGLSIEQFKDEPDKTSQYLACYGVMKCVYPVLLLKYKAEIAKFAEFIHKDVNDEHNLLSQERMLDLLLWRIGGEAII